MAVDVGIYYENINYFNKAITLANHYLINNDKSHIFNTISLLINPGASCPDGLENLQFRHSIIFHTDWILGRRTTYLFIDNSTTFI